MSIKIFFVKLNFFFEISGQKIISGTIAISFNLIVIVTSKKSTKKKFNLVFNLIKIYFSKIKDFIENLGANINNFRDRNQSTKKKNSHISNSRNKTN